MQMQIKGHTMERVTTYEYIKSTLKEDGRLELEITNRARKSNNLETILGKKK